MMKKIPKEKTLTREQLQRKYGLLRKLMSLVGNNKKRMGNEAFLDTEAGTVRVLTYNMDDPRRLPLLVNMHGGGFVLGSAEMDDPYLANVAENANVKILNVDYSLSPDVMFPTALNECYAVIKYAKAHSDELGLASEKIAVGGHSAGGNLSAAICLLDGEREELDIKCLILDYPPLDIYTDPYLKPLPKGALNPKMCRNFNAAYCSKEKAKNPLVSPVFATAHQVKSFPPTLLITAAIDSLCEEGEKFGETLKSAGVSVTHKRFNAKHGFTCSGSDYTNSNAAWQMMIDHLNRCFWNE